MFEIGDTLREARIRAGLSLKDVEDALKIRSKYLQALEQDDFEVLPGPTFVKAFLRTYSAFLGLDSELMMEEYLSRFEPQFREQHQILPGRTSSRGVGGRRRQPNYVVVGLIALAVMIVLALAFRSRGEEPAVIDPNATTTTSTTEASVIESGGTGDDTTTTAPEEGSTITTAAGEAGTATTEGGTATTAIPVEAAGGDPDGALDVVITATGSRCWLLIREESAGGKLLFSGVLEKGEELTYSTPGQIYLNVGAPLAVELVVDGQTITVPEPYGEFVLSKAGLERL